MGKSVFEKNDKLNDEKRIRLNDFPHTISIETSAHCNLKCVMCENPNMKRRKGNMDIVLFEKCIDEIKHFPDSRVYISGYGEPLFNEHIVEFVKYATENGVKNTYMNTNGMLLDRNISKELIDAGLHCLIVSVDGFTKDTYESIRVGGDRDVVYENVSQYLELIKSVGQSNQMVEVQFIEMNKTLPEEDMWIEYWRKQGAVLKIKPYLEWGGRKYEDESVVGDYEKRLACEICNEFMIMWNGDAALCTAGDVEITNTLGHINSESIKDLWEKKKKSFSSYHVLHEFDKLPDFCKRCNNWKIPFARVVQ